jgi:hypothetical protein
MFYFKFLTKYLLVYKDYVAFIFTYVLQASLRYAKPNSVVTFIPFMYSTSQHIINMKMYILRICKQGNDYRKQSLAVLRY